MPTGYKRITDNPTQIAYEGQKTTVSIFKRNGQWNVKAKSDQAVLGLGGEGVEEFIGQFPEREVAHEAAKMWMRENEKGISDSTGDSFGLDVGGGKDPFDLGIDGGDGSDFF